MSGQSVRVVNVVPLPKHTIKQEVDSGDDDDTICCKICAKGFVSALALRNHAMMEHFDAFSTGNPSKWTEPEPVVKKKKIKISSFSEQEELLIQQKTKAVLSSMKPGSLTSLASEDVNYIIIRSEDDCEPPTAKKKRLKLVKVDKPVKEVGKKPKEVQPITGPFECIQDGFCHRIFFSCCEFSTHYRDEHTRRRKGLRCQVCEKPLSLDVDECHPYACEVCGKGFSTSKQLSEHMSEAHVKLKPFQCTVCQKRFTQQGGVAQHMRMHTGDRPFSCTFCPKAFTQKSGLDQHLRIHTKVKPYRCVICSKAFCQSIHLKQHMRTHTNVSPFQCGICGKRFKQSSHLNYHLRNHNPHTMTEEQKQKYHELVGMMTREIVEVEVDQAEVPEEDQVIVEEIEQTAAEQSIQVKEELLIEQAGTEHYILSDGGQETWSVQLVEI